MRIEQTNKIDIEKIDTLYKLWYSSKKAKTTRIIGYALSALVLLLGLSEILSGAYYSGTFITVFGIAYLTFLILNFTILQRDRNRKANQIHLGTQRHFIITDESIYLESPMCKSEYKWNSIGSIADTGNYIAIRFIGNSVSLLEKAQLKEDEIAWLMSRQLS